MTITTIVVEYQVTSVKNGSSIHENGNMIPIQYILENPRVIPFFANLILLENFIP